jgi:hypothetical protein
MAELISPYPEAKVWWRYGNRTRLRELCYPKRETWQSRWDNGAGGTPKVASRALSTDAKFPRLRFSEAAPRPRTRRKLDPSAPNFAPEK